MIQPEIFRRRFDTNVDIIVMEAAMTLPKVVQYKAKVYTTLFINAVKLPIAVYINLS